MSDYSAVSIEKDWLNNILNPIIEDTGRSKKGYLKHTAVVYNILINENQELENAYQLISKIQEEKDVSDQELRKMMKEVVDEEN